MATVTGYKDFVKSSAQRAAAAGTKRLVLAVFRLATLSLALIEIPFDDQKLYLAPPLFIGLAAITYALFKVFHPFSWYRSPRGGMALIISDVIVCAAFVFAHREIHSPFAIDSLNPVLTAAVLFRPRVAWNVSAVTAAYYGANFFSYPLSMALQNLSSIFSTYMFALLLTTSLPYLANSNLLQKLHFKVKSEERLRLGREIHDGLCQTIYGLRLEMQMLRRDVNATGRINEGMQRLETLLDEAEKEARGSIELLRSCRNDQPLLLQIEDSLKHLKIETGIGYRLEASGGEPQLDDLVKIEVLNITGEALRNIAKHSGARQVTVKLVAPNGHLHVDIFDDGRGIESPGFVGGRGLMGMKERAELLGGHFQIASVPGYGTEIKVEVPRKWYPELQIARS